MEEVFNRGDVVSRERRK